MKGFLKKFLSAALAGGSAAVLFFVFDPKIGGWALVVVVVSFPIIFWLSQMIMDFLINEN